MGEIFHTLGKSYPHSFPQGFPRTPTSSAPADARRLAVGIGRHWSTAGGGRRASWRDDRHLQGGAPYAARSTARTRRRNPRPRHGLPEGRPSKHLDPLPGLQTPEPRGSAAISSVHCTYGTAGDQLRIVPAGMTPQLTACCRLQPIRRWRPGAGQCQRDRRPTWKRSFLLRTWHP